MIDNDEVRMDLQDAWAQGFEMGVKYAPEKPVEATGVPDWEGMHHGVVRKLDAANERIDALVDESARWEGIAGKNSDRVYELTDELETVNERVRVLDALAEESTAKITDLERAESSLNKHIQYRNLAIVALRKEKDEANARIKELEAGRARLNENNDVLASSCVALRDDRDGWRERAVTAAGALDDCVERGDVWEERARDFVKRIATVDKDDIAPSSYSTTSLLARNVAREVKEWDA